MKGFGVLTSMWTMRWDADGAARAIAAAKASGMDFIEIALLDPAATDAALGRRLLEAAPQDHCVIIALFRAKTSHDVGRELHGPHFWLLGPSSRTGRRARLERVSSCFAADKASEGGEGLTQNLNLGTT